MRFFLRIAASLGMLLALCQCETTDSGSSLPSGGGGTVQVQGTIFYPDTADTNYVVGAGAQVIGAGGENCNFIIGEGGSITAHSGKNNTYKIKSGGHFRGFTHPATNCKVLFEPGAIIEQEQTGPGTVFTAQ